MNNALHFRINIPLPACSLRPSARLEQKTKKALIKPGSNVTKRTRTTATPATAAFPSSSLSMIQALSAHWLAVSGVAVCAYLIVRILRFSKADADASLLSAKHPPPNAYRGKSVWITGASQGLGARLALDYYRLGAHVILSSRSREKLEAVAAAVVEVSSSPSSSSVVFPPPPRPTVLPFDALAPYEKLAEAAFEAAEASKKAWQSQSQSSPRLALLVLCAGASQHAAASATTAEVSDAILELNAAAPIRLTRAALPHLLETAGAATAGESGKKKKNSTPPSASVLGVASMAALVPSPGQAAYSASKAALALYLRSVEAELFDKGFRATVVYPGPLAAGSSSSSVDGENSSSPSCSIFSTTAVRTVYGSTGLKREGAEAVSTKAKEDRKRLPAERASSLIVTACYNGIGEAMLGKNPVLLLGHLARGSFGGPSWSLPQRLLRKVLAKVGPARASALEEGKGGYDAGALLSSSASAGKKQA